MTAVAAVYSIDHHFNSQIVYCNNKHLRCEFLSKDMLNELVDCLGEESSKAQNLQIPITTSAKFTTSSNEDFLYLIFTDGIPKLKPIGFIRVGKRDLYFDDGTSLKHIPNCPCILDFYIRAKRRGYGKMLYDLVLQKLDLKPEKLAYDRPSPSMLSFLNKYYSLDKPLWQHNHFVIFSGMFS